MNEITANRMTKTVGSHCPYHTGPGAKLRAPRPCHPGDLWLVPTPDADGQS